MTITKKWCRGKGLKYQKTIMAKIPQAYMTLRDGDIGSFHPFWSKVNIECKHVERLNVWQAISQSMKDMHSKGKDAWCVVFTRNREGRDYVVLNLDMLLELVEEARKL